MQPLELLEIPPVSKSWQLQEYLRGPLDKKPARQAGIELAGKVEH